MGFSVKLTSFLSFLCIGFTFFVAFSCVLIAYFSDGMLEPGDGIEHYMIAKYSWYKPELFFYHWGKPIFTFLSSPFAQLGFYGMVFFNATVFCFSVWFLFKTFQKLELPFGWIIPFLLIGSPVYYHCLVGGMTEILLAGIVSATFYFLVFKKPRTAAIIFSFVFFSRPEGVVIFPFFLIFYLLYHRRETVFLFTGMILYSIVGAFHHETILWYFTKDPYPAKSIYGSGSFWNYIEKFDQILGGIFLLIFLFALFALIFFWIKRKFPLKKTLKFLLLVLFPFLAILLVHSFIWSQGLKGSLGLIRVMTTILPFVVIVVGLGLTQIHLSLKKKYRVPFVFLLIVISILGIVQLIGNKVLTNIPIQKTLAEIKKSAQWINKHHPEKRIAYFHPSYSFFADINPYDRDKVIPKGFMKSSAPTKNLEDGDLIVWDAHFGGAEGNLLLDKLLEHKQLKLLKSFLPQERIKVIGGLDFGVYVFEVKRQKINVSDEFNFNIDFTDISIQAEKEFTKLIDTTIVNPHNHFIQIASIHSYLGKVDLTNGDVNYVIDATSEDNQYYFSESLIFDSTNTLAVPCKLPQMEKFRLKCYFWNISKKDLTLDSCRINLSSF